MYKFSCLRDVLFFPCFVMQYTLFYFCNNLNEEVSSRHLWCCRCHGVVKDFIFHFRSLTFEGLHKLIKIRVEHRKKKVAFEFVVHLKKMGRVSYMAIFHLCCPSFFVFYQYILKGSVSFHL